MWSGKVRIGIVMVVLTSLASASFLLYQTRGTLKKSVTRASVPKQYTVTNTTPGTEQALGVSITCISDEVQDQYGNTSGWNVTVHGDNLDASRSAAGVKIRVPWGAVLDGTDHITGTNFYNDPVRPSVVATAETLAASGFAGSVVQCSLGTPSTPEPTPKEQPKVLPVGSFDSASCSVLSGWAVDSLQPDKSIDVYMYRDGEADKGGIFVQAVPTNIERSDVNTSLHVTGIHGFSIPTPSSFIDGQQHQMYMYAQDPRFGQGRALLLGSPKAINCPLSALPKAIGTDVSVEQTVNVPKVSLGELVTFTIGIKNNGPQVANKVVLEDKLPTGLFLVKATVSDGTYTNQSGLWNVGSLSIGQSAELKLEIKAGLVGKFANAVRLIAVEPSDSSLVNNQIESDLEVTGAADTTLTCVPNEETVFVNQSAVYAVIGGTGTYEWSAPSGSQVSGMGPNFATTYSETGVHVITVTSGTQKTSCSVSVEEAPKVVPVFDLAITEQVSPAVVVVGQTALFTVTLKNRTQVVASNVLVSALMPSSFKLEKYAVSVGDYVPATGVWNVGTIPAGQTVTATFNVTSQNARTVTAQAVLGGSVPEDTDNSNNVASATLYTNTTTALQGPLACVLSTNSANVGQVVTAYAVGGNIATRTWSAPDGSSTSGGGSNFSTLFSSAGKHVITLTSEQESAECTVDVKPLPVGTSSANLSLVQSITPTSISLDGKAVIVLTITNAGPDVANLVSVKENLPSGLSMVNLQAGQGTYDKTNGLWNVGSVGPTQHITLLITVKAIRAGKYTSSAEIFTSGSKDPNSTPNNGLASEDDAASAAITVTGENANTTLPITPIAIFAGLCILALLAALRVKTKRDVRLHTPGGHTQVDFGAPVNTPSS